VQGTAHTHTATTARHFVTSSIWKQHSQVMLKDIISNGMQVACPHLSLCWPLSHAEPGLAV
jgi:hypothetical protein